MLFLPPSNKKQATCPATLNDTAPLYHANESNLTCVRLNSLNPIVNTPEFASERFGPAIMRSITSLRYRRFLSRSLEVNPYDDPGNEARATILHLDMGILKAVSTSFD